MCVICFFIWLLNSDTCTHILKKLIIIDCWLITYFSSVCFIDMRIGSHGLNEGRNVSSDGDSKERERFSGHKSCHNQPALQHRMKSKNKTGQIDELIVQDGWQHGRAWLIAQGLVMMDRWTGGWMDGNICMQMCLHLCGFAWWPCLRSISLWWQLRAD